ncbi:hypothetical protein JD969_01910 [Planctomycetota bacterium]|nr:hypothetical protein JD969_01910 [Planctomycetota bacterium]
MRKNSVLIVCMTVLALGGLLMINVSSNAHPKEHGEHVKASRMTMSYSNEHADYDDMDEEDFDDEFTEAYELTEAREMDFILDQLELMDGFMESCKAYSEITEDPTASAIAAVFSAEEFFVDWEDYGKYLVSLLPEVKSTPVKRAIYMKLAEIMNDPDSEGNRSEGLNYLSKIITNKID